MTKNKIVEKTFIKKLKNSMRVSILQIVLSGLLIGLGVIMDTYLRIGHFTFITTSIYIIIGLILPLWLGVAAAFAIDTFQLLLRGLIGYWYWSIQLEPAIIVTISFIFRFMYSIIKSKKILMILSISFLTIVAVGSIAAISIDYKQLSFRKLVINNFIETDSQFWIRIVRRYLSIVGLLFIVAIAISEIYKFSRKSKNTKRIASMIVVVITSLIIDWLYHPWSVYNWRLYTGIAQSEFIYQTYIISGIWSSTFHIAIGIPLVSSIYYVAEHFDFSNKNKH